MKSSGGSRISRRGGVDLVGGGVHSRGGYVSKILYVKMKELGPLGGAHAGHAPPTSANEKCTLFVRFSCAFREKQLKATETAELNTDLSF